MRRHLAAVAALVLPLGLATAGKVAPLLPSDPLPRFSCDVLVERLYGRSTWRAVPTGVTQDPRGPIVAYLIPDTSAATPTASAPPTPAPSRHRSW